MRVSAAWLEGATRRIWCFLGALPKISCSTIEVDISKPGADALEIC